MVNVRGKLPEPRAHGCSVSANRLRGNEFAASQSNHGDAQIQNVTDCRVRQATRGHTKIPAKWCAYAPLVTPSKILSNREGRFFERSENYLRSGIRLRLRAFGG